MAAPITPSTNHRVPSSRAVTPAGEGSPSSRPSPAPLSPLECNARRTEGGSPTDRLNRDIDGLASFSPWTVSRDHWWCA